MKRWFRRYSLTAGSAGYGAAMALVLALLLLASGVTPVARAQPEPPHQFYGNVYIGGSLAAAGTKVEARVNNVKQAETTVDSQHRYGYSPLFKVPGSAGTVTFYIGATSTKAVQEVAWESGGINRDDGQPLHLSDTAIDLTIMTTSLPNGQVDTYYSQTLQASGGTTPYTWSYTGSLPTGLSLSASGVISGTPTVIETSYFTAQVTDAVMATDTQSLSITVTGDGVLDITTSCPLPSGQKDQPYYPNSPVTLQASGGTTPYTWSKVSGTLPTNLSLSTGGVISGTPTATGTFNFRIKVTDSASPTPATKEKDCSITVTGDGVLDITTSCPLDGGRVNQSYPVTLHATGGTLPYTWSKVSGNLPTGLSLSTGGEISGTPTAAGTFSFTIKVTDSATPTHATKQKACSITISSGPPTPVRTAPSITLKWNASTGATKYWLQVNTKTSFKGIDLVNADVGNVTSYELPGLTGEKGSYYWRVKAGDDESWGDWTKRGRIYWK